MFRIHVPATSTNGWLIGGTQINTLRVYRESWSHLRGIDLWGYTVFGHALPLRWLRGFTLGKFHLSSASRTMPDGRIFRREEIFLIVCFKRHSRRYSLNIPKVIISTLKVTLYLCKQITALSYSPHSCSPLFCFLIYFFSKLFCVKFDYRYE